MGTRPRVSYGPHVTTGDEAIPLVLMTGFTTPPTLRLMTGLSASRPEAVTDVQHKLGRRGPPPRSGASHVGQIPHLGGTCGTRLALVLLPLQEFPRQVTACLEW